MFVGSARESSASLRAVSIASRSSVLIRPRSGSGYARPIDAPPRFVVGEVVRARNINPATHTRLPRYARGKAGVVAADHGGFVFPDSNAIGEGESPKRLYTVRFTAQELWGERAHRRDTVSLDLWEPYLEHA